MQFTADRTSVVNRLTALLVGATLILSLVALTAQNRPATKAAPQAAKQSAAAKPTQPAKPKLTTITKPEKTDTISVDRPLVRTFDLRDGQTIEISVHLDKPSVLPPNGRVLVEWSLNGDPGRQKPDGKNPLELYTTPSANWKKTLHALDNDVYLVYRAPRAGQYTLRVAPQIEESDSPTAPRWREKGNVPTLVSFPKRTPWQANLAAPVSVNVQTIAFKELQNQEQQRAYLESEPNETPEQAQPIVLTGGDDVQTWQVFGGADDVEFFDNNSVGVSGEDWYRLEYKGNEPRLLTAQLGIPNQNIVARLRFYKLNLKSGEAVPNPLPVVEYSEGKNDNERVHQQDEQHRASICRIIKPGETYFVRVEANTPGYQLEIRTLKPAPYTDPKMAVRQGMYQHIGQVDAWLTNRPRGAAVERRLRDTGNLLGTQCMSCHTQSGVWGPAVPIQYGYRLENPLPFWHMVNVLYECLRPTNVLKDAANNTSLAPLDIGDGPAGTRAAGYNIVNLEKLRAPSALHAKQQVRTANYILLTSDPGGINAAGPGSNVGQAIVYLFSAEILKTAWEKTNDPKYFRALEDKARLMLKVDPRYTDDIAVRLDFFGRLFPLNRYLGEAQRAGDAERAANLPVKTDPAAVDAFITKVKTQLEEDEKRLRSIQNADGTWNFNPGKSDDNGKTWKIGEANSDPAPTALAITGLTSMGYGKDDPNIAKGVKALLAQQEPNGRWNKAAQTGFVTTSYVLHALARLYPETPSKVRKEDVLPQPNETLITTLKRVQKMALTADPQFTDILLKEAKHTNPTVRYWALVGLGMGRSPKAVPVLMASLSDRVKMVREAGTWAMRESLLNDKGWDAILAACEKGNDDVRAQAMQVLGMRADAVMPKATLNWTRLTTILDKGMNSDPHPAVRAWASKAAWQWWVWNPPVRTALNSAWITMLTRAETSVLVENTQRYSSQALFVANGHKANGSSEHQYKELQTLFESFTKRLDSTTDSNEKFLLARRLVAIGGTFFQTAGGDGGPGQMGYVTPGSGEMMGKASLVYLQQTTKGSDASAIRAGLEGAANVPYQPLTSLLVDYSLKGPEEFRQLAASSVSDPRSVSLAAVPELVEPQLIQIKRGAMEPTRRKQLSDPIIALWSKVNWVIPQTEEQQRNFFDLVIPKFDNYLSPAQIAALPDPAKRTEAEREMNANWYLADNLGEVLQLNPDLHQKIVLLRYFPAMFRNPLEERYWVQNVDWILTYSAEMMADAKITATETDKGGLKLTALQGAQDTKTQEAQAPDPVSIVKDRALQLYLDQLKPTADPKSRALAIRKANQTALRTNPEVLRALEEVLKFEQTPELRSIITNALKQSSEKFLPDLIKALKEERDPSVKFNDKGEPLLSKAQHEDFIYFRDYVMPELNRQKRTDQQGCVGCHGVTGRVPSYYIKPPDKFGYSTVADMLSNYRTAQKKVNLSDLEKSKFLRKPLNIQDGKEDGHQGGRRYTPTDPGYLILKKWVDSQPVVQQPAEKQTTSNATERKVGIRRQPKDFWLRPKLVIGNRRELDALGS